MRQLRWVMALPVLGGFCWFAVGSAGAQSPTTGQITGVAKDPSGGVVPDAKITLTSDAGVQREIASDATGHYTFSLVPPGYYRMEAEKQGFGKATAEGVTVRITEITHLDIRLELAAQKATVEVTGEAPLVQADNATRGRSSNRSKSASYRCRQGISSNS